MLTRESRNEFRNAARRRKRKTRSSSARKVMTRPLKATLINRKRFAVLVRGEIDLERRLFRVFRLRCKRDIVFHFDEFYECFLRLLKVWRCSSKLRTKVTRRSWLAKWCSKYGIASEDEPPSANEELFVSIKTECPIETRKSPDLADTLNEYGEDEIYLFFCFHFCWSSLPDRALAAEKGNVEDDVWLLMAANRSGRHRTRVCVLGKELQPACLERVNMLSQPVVYASFDPNGLITSDLFAWWFYHEFSPGALAINRKVALLVEDRAHLACGKFVSEDARAKVLLIAANATERNAVQMEFRVRYAKLFFSLILVEERNWTCQAYISRFTLKDVFPLLHKAWLTIRIETFERHFNELLLSASDYRASCLHHADDAIEDGKLLLELQWIAHDLGLEVCDQDLVKWAYSGEVPLPAETETASDLCNDAKEEPVNSYAATNVRIPTAREAAVYLTKALTWMETEPFDPHFLLFVRHLIVLAKQASKMGLPPPMHPGTGLPFFCHNGDHLGQPPPAHTGYNPYQLDPKGSGEYWRGVKGTPPVQPDWHHRLNGLITTPPGLPRPALYPFAGSQYPYPMLSPEISQVAAATWHTSGVYPISSSSPGFRSPYPNTSDFYRFSPTGILPGHPPGLSPHSHPAIVTPGIKQELIQSEINHRSSVDHKHSSNDSSKLQDSCHNANSQDKKKPHIKKPLNAFMLYMKEMRSQVVAECTLKESAAINQILGRRWHSLSRDEQAKYYEKARQERQLHMELYPGWSARDNYGYGAKKKKRKKERVPIIDSGGGRDEQAKYYELARRERQIHMQLYPDWSSRASTTRIKKRKKKQETHDGGNNMKKCRARYGLDQQNQWCKPCRRKKRCVRYVESGDSGNQSEDNVNSCGSAGDVRSPGDDDGESLQHSESSPGNYSVLSSLTSPSVIQPSPNTSQTSPSVSLASPCMNSLQSPLTPHPLEYECPTSKPPPPPCLPMPLQFFGPLVPPSRHPVGTNPHDINNPLSVNQLTGKCIKNSPSSSSISSSSSNSTNKDSRSAIQVT